jgi:energy-coupling factor transporter ATP-binding protein EcfA2
MTHPPTAEAVGLLAQVDSMPVFAMPADRQDRDLYLGHIINGERAQVTAQRFGIDIDETTHVLAAGTTGSGKTTMLKRLLVELAGQEREIVDVHDGEVTRRTARAGALVIDWGAERTYRGLAHLVGPDRFRLWDLADRRVGGFRFNLLSLPDENMDPMEWCGTVADLFMISYGLGEYARNIFFEIASDLYSANRLEPYVLRPEVVDGDGVLIRDAVILPAVAESELGEGTVAVDVDGVRVANVRTHPQLSRLVGLEHIAVVVAARIEEGATSAGRAMGGSAMQDRLQTVWRRIMNFAPGAPLQPLVAADRSLSDMGGVRISDLVNPDQGWFSILEVDGLDQTNRRLILGGIVQSLFRWGQHLGGGGLDHHGKGPGTWLVLEEAHELFGENSAAEDREAASTRVAVWTTLYRRARQLGLHVVGAVQNPAEVPNSILGNCSTIISHQVQTEEDKRTIASLFNWMAAIGQHYRETRYLGEMAMGHCLVRLAPKSSYLQAAPVHVAIDPPVLPRISDELAVRLSGKR